ncbi:unnamed protein product [Chrysodeixis includens]|uniref:UDP-glucuronosyltransferase n=1 Tax=Chrysodeixis includens TaxID=689277 RepID=A0A9P0FVR9_CHRIL|nr:unnamed protein product [Chrysodeixis includens]
MQYRTAVGLLLLSIVSSNEALRLLVAFGAPSKSHSILGHGVVNRLLEAGHEVVHITSFPRKNPPAKLKEIDVSAILEEFTSMAEQDDRFKLKNMIGQANIGDSVFFAYFTAYIHRKLLDQPNILSLLTDPNEKFDAVILEWFFSEMLVGIPQLFECPLIWVSSTESHWQALRLMDEVPNPSYTVDLFSSSRPPLNFWQRADGLWKILKKVVLVDPIVTIYEMYVYNNVYPELAAKRGVTLSSYSEVVYNASLMLVNSHPSIGGSIKLPQNVKNIGGYHIDTDVKPLPKDLQKLMDEAKHGVIYFSMGSNLKSQDMSAEMKRGLLKMFSKFQQQVIWKFEGDMESVPANVLLLKWAPQPSILNHPNLKLFITHGGLLSTTESIHFGVPVVGIPVMADQHLNMKTVHAKGFGICVTLSEDMIPELKEAVKKIIVDPTYRNKAKELSRIYHDRPMTPGVELPYWVEHIVSTQGAPHLRSPALDVPLYKRYYIDLAICLAVVFLALKKAVRFLLNKRSKSKPKRKTN